ncbi:hypothetical protein BG842_03180 [Haladaptatus sp. W1]|nr:hypothetical protein BG842_03180 [Haladaptatus sp. W1]
MTLVEQSYNNPVPAEKVNEIRSSTVTQAATRHGADDDKQVSIGAEGSGRLVAVAAGATPDGVVLQVLGFAGSPESVGDVQKEVREEAAEYSKRIKAARHGKSTTISGVLTTASEGDWTELESDTIISATKPRGKLKNKYTLSRDLGAAMYVFEDKWTTYPGMIEWPDDPSITGTTRMVKISMTSTSLTTSSWKIGNLSSPRLERLGNQLH